MKTTLVSILAFLVLGSAAVLPSSADSSIMDTAGASTVSTSIPDESAATEGSMENDFSIPAAENDPDSSMALETSDVDTIDVDSDDADNAASPGSDEENGQNRGEAEGITLPDEYILLLVTNQADSIMGAKGVERSADCTQVVAVIPLAECRGATEDEAYFKAWERLNAALTTQAENGVAKLNCTCQNAEIIIMA